MEELKEYIKSTGQHILKNIMKNPREAAFIIRFGISSKKAKKRRESLRKEGKVATSFLIETLNKQCNLFCDGCKCEKNMFFNSEGICWKDLFDAAKKMGVSSIIFAGEESLERRDVIYEAAKVKNIIFPLFTKGKAIEEDDIKLFDENRNLVPILNMGIEDNYNSLMNVADILHQRGIFYGLCIRINRKNIDKVINNEFLEVISKKGCNGVLFIEDKSENNISEFNEKERVFFEEKQYYFRDKFKNMIVIYLHQKINSTERCLFEDEGIFKINENGEVVSCKKNIL